MKTKTQLKIGGKVFKVEYIKGLADYGSTDFFRQTILIKEDMTDDNKISAVLHEILEITNEANDLDLKHQTIQTIEANLFQIFKDNFS